MSFMGQSRRVEGTMPTTELPTSDRRACLKGVRSGNTINSSRRERAWAHSGNPAFRRPSINSFVFDSLFRAIVADIEADIAKVG
jgi:hypothetical protein